MRNFYLLFIVFLFILINSCDNAPNPNHTLNENNEKIDTIINVIDIVNKNLKDVESVLGKANRKENVTGYPCENVKCFTAYFENGKYEILFKQKLSNRITINNISNLKLNRNAIVSLGLPKVSPSFKNENAIYRWTAINGIKEIQFNGDGHNKVSWIYITVN